jgi:hypothetical protein
VSTANLIAAACADLSVRQRRFGGISIVACAKRFAAGAGEERFWGVQHGTRRNELAARFHQALGCGLRDLARYYRDRVLSSAVVEM